MNQTRQPLPITVGVDGSRGSRTALEFALAEGAARKCMVEIVTAWSLGPAMRETITPTIRIEQTAAARRLQDEILAEIDTPVNPRPEIVHRLIHGDAGEALVTAARDSAMLIVGSGHKNAVTRTLIGSVSEHCVRHAPVPVVVVPGPAKVAGTPESGLAAVGPRLR